MSRHAVGDTRFRKGRWQQWTGRRWSTAPWSVDPPRLSDPRPLVADAPVPLEVRERLVREATADQLLRGATVLAQEPTAVTVSWLRPVSHGTHFVLTLLTLVWGFVWVVMAVARQTVRVRLEVDERGHLWPVEAT